MKVKKIKYVQKLLIIVYRRKRAQIESIVIYRKNNSKEHNNMSIEEILSLCFWDSSLLENTIFWLVDDTNSNIVSYVSLQIKNRTWSFERETNLM